MTHRYTTAQAFPPLHIINRELYDPIVYLKAHSLEHESPTLAGTGFEQVIGLEYHHHKLKHRTISLIPMPRQLKSFKVKHSEND
jgi:hypothetical protein